MTEKEIDEYLATPATRLYLKTLTFHQLGIELDRRLASGPLTVQQAADIMGLPVDVFRRLYGSLLADELPR